MDARSLLIEAAFRYDAAASMLEKAAAATGPEQDVAEQEAEEEFEPEPLPRKRAATGPEQAVAEQKAEEEFEPKPPPRKRPRQPSGGLIGARVQAKKMPQMPYPPTAPPWRLGKTVPPQPYLLKPAPPTAPPPPYLLGPAPPKGPPPPWRLGKISGKSKDEGSGKSEDEGKGSGESKNEGKGSDKSKAKNKSVRAWSKGSVFETARR